MTGLPEFKSRRVIYQLFAEALELPLPARRQFLEENCKGDPGIRSDIDALLRTAEGAGIDTRALDGTAVKPEESMVGRLVGRFRLLEYIGEGGMGVVYLAARTDGVQQSVAIKLVSSMLAKAAQARFFREAQILARLEHSSVARLIDAGIEDGRAWIAMEYVRGERIDSYCESRKLSADAIVRLLVPLAGAVSAAHALLVVHSDIKPANVLVTPDAQPKLIDFGISTALREAGAEHAPTLAIERLFSPNYAAAEQVDGGSVTVATDVFGLGALSYRLLTGMPIHRDATSALAYLLAVTQRDVELPSRAALAAAHTGIDARRLRGDLDAILSKALERDPKRRYASAADFQADLQRYLEARPVFARAPSPGYRLGKFIRRNALAVGLSSLLGMSLIAGGVAAWIQARNAAIAREMTARRGEFLEGLLKSADPRGGKRDITVAQLLDASTKEIDTMTRSEPLVAASMLCLVAETDEGLGRYAEGLAANDRALALLRTAGGSAKDLSAALSTRGELLMMEGRYHDAEAPLREAISVVEHVPGAYKQLGLALDDLGAAYQDSREKDSEIMFKRAIEVYQRGGAALFASPAAADPVANLGVLYYNEGRIPEALRYMREAFDERRKSLPPDHPDLLAAESNYASALEANGQVAVAEPMLRELLAAYTRVSGPQHVDTLMSATAVAHNLFKQGRYPEAMAIALPAAQSMSAVAGDSHQWSQAAWGMYGIAACLGGHGDEGLAALRRVAAERRLGPDATEWRKDITDAQIGACLVALHRYQEAEPLLLATAASLHAIRGASYEYTQVAYRALRDMYAAIGRPQESATWQARLLPAER